MESLSGAKRARDGKKQQVHAIVSVFFPDHGNVDTALPCLPASFPPPSLFSPAPLVDGEGVSAAAQKLESILMRMRGDPLLPADGGGGGNAVDAPQAVALPAQVRNNKQLFDQVHKE
jgi:hypothetical protein